MAWSPLQTLYSNGRFSTNRKMFAGYHSPTTPPSPSPPLLLLFKVLLNDARMHFRLVVMLFWSTASNFYFHWLNILLSLNACCSFMWLVLSCLLCSFCSHSAFHCLSLALSSISPLPEPDPSSSTLVSAPRHAHRHVELLCWLKRKCFPYSMRFNGRWIIKKKNILYIVAVFFK